MRYIFQEDTQASNNGVDIIDFKEGQIVGQDDLSEYLISGFLARGVIAEVNAEDEAPFQEPELPVKEEEDEQQAEEAQTDAENVGETIQNETQESSEQVPPQAEETPAEETAGQEAQNEDAQSPELDGETPAEVKEEEENPLVAEAKAILDQEDKDIDRLKEIGIGLGIENIDRCSKPETIVAKIKTVIEDLAQA